MGRRSCIKVGQKFGKLTAIEIIPSNKSGEHSIIKCLCDCGETNEVYSHLLKSKMKSCGCSQFIPDDLTGRLIGKIRVVKLVTKNAELDNNRGHMYECFCQDCNRAYKFQTSALKRVGFVGCRCDKTKRSRKITVYNSYKCNAKSKNRRFDLSFDKFVELCEGDCYYCGDEPSNISEAYLEKWVYNGIDRINNEIGYTPENCVPCCKACNFAKSGFSFEQFLDRVRKIAHKHKLC